MTNKKFQVAAIKRLLKQKGIDPDLIDVDARVDSTLSLRENARIIVDDVKVMQGTGQIKPETASVAKLTRFLLAVNHFEKRKSYKQMIDARFQAKKTFEKSELTKQNYRKWKDGPNRYDIQGIDSRY